MKQQSLFPTQANALRGPDIPGFSICENYISPEEEKVLLAHVDEGPWQTDWRRRIQQYGLGYGAGSGAPTWLRDIPDWLQPLARRVAQDARFPHFPENC